MVHTMSFLPKTTIKFNEIHEISVTVSAQVMGWCATRRAILCLWGVTQPSLDVYRWLEELLPASTSPSWPILHHFFPKVISSFRQNVRFWVAFQHRKWHDVLRWEVYIDVSVCHSLYYMCNENWRSFHQHIRAPGGQYHVISDENQSQFHAKYQLLGTLSEWKYGCCTATRDIHCCLTVS